ncbi:MAG: hypothetical protein JWP63_6197, partial [Candidatus Solibacter sp.]|nr:hypothetical protein [Candidatus Solibacter sp.]
MKTRLLLSALIPLALTAQVT